MGITFFVALSMLGACVGLFKGLTMKAEMIAKHPRLEPPKFWIYFAVVPLTIVSRCPVDYRAPTSIDCFVRR